MMLGLWKIMTKIEDWNDKQTTLYIVPSNMYLRELKFEKQLDLLHSITEDLNTFFRTIPEINQVSDYNTVLKYRTV